MLFIWQFYPVCTCILRELRGSLYKAGRLCILLPVPQRHHCLWAYFHNGYLGLHNCHSQVNLLCTMVPMFSKHSMSACSEFFCTPSLSSCHSVHFILSLPCSLPYTVEHSLCLACVRCMSEMHAQMEHFSYASLWNWNLEVKLLRPREWTFSWLFTQKYLAWIVVKLLFTDLISVSLPLINF